MSNEILTRVGSLAKFQDFLGTKFPHKHMIGNEKDDYLGFLKSRPDYPVNKYIVADHYIDVSHIYDYFIWVNNHRHLGLSDNELIYMYHEWITKRRIKTNQDSVG